MSKTPSSRSGGKRSVRFCPVSVIVDEDCGEKKVVREDREVQEKKRKEMLDPFCDTHTSMDQTIPERPHPLSSK